MNNERYWIDRANYLIYHHMTDAEQIADEIAILYRKASKWLIYEARKIFDRYQNSHGLTESEARRLISQLQDSSSLEELKRSLAQDGRNREILAQLDSPAYQYRIDHLRQIQNQLDIVMKNVYQQEKILAGDFFVDLANDSYYRQIYEIQHNTSYAFSFAHIDKKQIDKVISMPWSGKHYSERLWKNSKTLTKAIKEELLLDLITGRPENEAVKIIANKFNQGIFETRRLIRTEAAFVSGELNAEAYKECDLQKYRFLATLDLRTSKICQSLDGKTFFLKDRQVGKNYPPMHPWCRSTTIAFVSQDDLNNLKRRAFNPKTGRTELVPASMTYTEWYEKYVKGDPNAEAQEKMLKNRPADKKQFEEYRGILGEDAPKTFAKFQDMKYNETEKWELLQTYAHSVKNGMISPLSGFKNYEKLYGEINKNIVGVKTSEGTEVSRQSKHFMERVVGTMKDPKTGRPRSGVTIEEISDALNNPVVVRPIRVDSQGEKSQKYIGNKATVSMDPDTGILIQCNPTSEKLIRGVQNGKI